MEGGGGGGGGEEEDERPVVVAAAGEGGERDGIGRELYKEVRTPNSQYQWDFLAESQIHSITPIKNNI